MDRIYFHGGKIYRSKNPCTNALFQVKTVFSDYYIEEKPPVDIPVTLTIKITNPHYRPVNDVDVEFLGMRNDYHQRVLDIRSEYDIQTRFDSLGNILHILNLQTIPARSSVEIKIHYRILVRPYSTKHMGFRYNIEEEVVETLKEPKPLQRHTSKAISRIIKEDITSSDVLGRILRAVGWILGNIKYERTYRRYSVTDTLKRRRGSCLSVSDLLVAILRGCGIPACVVRGFYLDQPHAWVEAYIENNGGFIVCPIDSFGGMVCSIGSIWISQHAEMWTGKKNISMNRKGLLSSYLIVIPR